MQGQSADSLRHILDSVFAGRAYAWPAVPTAPVPGWLHWLRAVVEWVAGRWPHFSAGRGAGLSLLTWGLVGVGVLLLVHGLFRAAAAVRMAHDVALGPDAAPALRHDDAWFRRRADDLAAEGRYAEAMVAAFHGVMWRLDQRGVVAHRVGRTPRELVRDARVAPAEGRALSLLVGELYAAAFGGLAVGPTRYAEWLASLDRLGDAPAH